MGVGRRSLEPCFSRAILDVEDIKVNGRRVDAAALNGFQCARMCQDVRCNGLVAPNQALAGKILLEFERFYGEGLCNAANAAVLQWCQSAEMQFAFFKVALSDALILHGEQQALIVVEVKFF